MIQSQAWKWKGGGFEWRLILRFMLETGSTKQICSDDQTFTTDIVIKELLSKLYEI